MTENLNTVDLRERIALCKDFSPEERSLILSALALGDYSNVQTYPENPEFGTKSPHWFVRAAWKLLDQLPPDAMKPVHRFMLSGMLAGALQRAAHGER